MIDIGIAAQERGVFRINDPSDLGIRMAVADGRYRWQGMNDIAQ